MSECIVDTCQVVKTLICEQEENERLRKELKEAKCLGVAELEKSLKELKKDYQIKGFSLEVKAYIWEEIKMTQRRLAELKKEKGLV